MEIAVSSSIQVLFIAGGSAAQIPDRYKGKTDYPEWAPCTHSQSKGQVQPPQRTGLGTVVLLPHSGPPVRCPSRSVQFVILIKKALGRRAQKNIQFIRQGGGFRWERKKGAIKSPGFTPNRAKSPALIRIKQIR